MNETVAERIRRLRIERGLSQRELASRGVSYAYISRIEAGSRRPSVRALRTLAARLRVDPHYLETGISGRTVDLELLARVRHLVRTRRNGEAEDILNRIIG